MKKKILGIFTMLAILCGIIEIIPHTPNTHVHAATSKNWSWPTNITSIKSDWPIYSSSKKYHGGTDFPVSLNSPVYSTCYGEVVMVKSMTTSYGKHIKIKATVNGSTVYIRYCHLNSFKVSEGDKVQSGQLIGYSGSTGNSTGPHLHYEVRDSNDRYGNSSNPNLNPKNYLPGTSYAFYIPDDDFGNNTPVEKPIDVGTNFCAYIINTKANIPLSADSNNNVWMKDEPNCANQVWKFTRQNDGSYKIINCKTGLALDAGGGTDLKENLGSTPNLVDMVRIF